MAIVNALAGIMVSELTTAEAWYELLLSRPADARYDGELGEWKPAAASAIQCFRQKACGVVLGDILVSGLDDQLAELKAKGISIEHAHIDHVKTATVTDPAGNQWSSPNASQH
jgi:hypothetical protein